MAGAAVAAAAVVAYAIARRRRRGALRGLGAYVGGQSHVLVTGGTGYIGSHTVLLLLQAGHEVTIVDNLVNSSPESLVRVARLAGDGASARLHFVELDLCNAEELEALLSFVPKVDSCIHFAGLKAVGESTQKPLLYYDNNVAGTVNLLQAMQRHKIHKIVFSSSATVYGSAVVPITEDSPVGAGITNAYGRSKYVIEEILGDTARSPDGSDWGICVLRYFNPVGAHPSGEIGEDPNGPPNNLMPYVSQVAVGRRPFLSVFGSDYDTHDGTGVRDYIHVMDLATGHLMALDVRAVVGGSGRGGGGEGGRGGTGRLPSSAGWRASERAYRARSCRRCARPGDRRGA